MERKERRAHTKVTGAERQEGTIINSVLAYPEECGAALLPAFHSAPQGESVPPRAVCERLLAAQQGRLAD